MKVPDNERIHVLSVDEIRSYTRKAGLRFIELNVIIRFCGYMKKCELISIEKYT